MNTSTLSHTLSHVHHIGYRMFLALAMGCALTIAMVSGSWGKELPPPEPSETQLVDEDVNIITGLYTREYSLTGDGKVDYKTARQIVLSEYNDHWNTVVETKEYPLFYWYDANHDGQFAMWIDQQVEGCTCDIMPYEWQASAQPTHASVLSKGE